MKPRSGNGLSTRFASPERAGERQLEAQSLLIWREPLTHEVLDAMPNIVLLLNADRQIVAVNHAFLQSAGTDDELDVLGLRPGEVLNCIHAYEEQAGCGTSEFCQQCGAADAILKSQSGKKAVSECRIVANQGRTHYDLRTSAAPLMLGDELFTIFSIEDIADKKRRQALERIFFHDVANSLAIVSGLADLVRADASEQQIECANELCHAIGRLTSEISGQQTLLAAERGELIVQPTTIETSKILRQHRAQLAHATFTRDRQLVVASDSEAHSLVTDATLLGRVLANMIKNALEASQPSDRVSIGARSHPAGIEFWVHNPTAMTREVQAQIFQRSFSTRGEGRGLGTYSMKLLSELYLQGEVSFESSPAEGTVFRARYPLELGASRE